MRITLFGAMAAASAAVALTAGAVSTGGGADNAPSIIARAPDNSVTPEEAARFAKQASFGPTPELISAIVAKKSLAAWIDEQFSAPSSSYADLAEKAVAIDYCSSVSAGVQEACRRDNFSGIPVLMRFYSNAVHGQDQLRQRVAFALSQILVVSEADVHNSSAIATYQQILLSNSFGNYRDILKQVTLNPAMGEYLDVADSNRAQPNENYAREFMQLFSIGTIMLNVDGTPQADSAGATIPAYSNADVKEIARALTGWTWARLKNAPLTDYNNRDWSRPMVSYTVRFDAGAKSFLANSISENASQDLNVDKVVDAVFYHPNAAPFVSKRLIQQLTLANPTPAYVGRVASVFTDNGAGVRGDMKAVIKAILLDDEARIVSQIPGKVKEPVLFATSLARAIGFTTDGYAFYWVDGGMGQAPFRSPSVFNFYPYDFPLPQGSGVVSPVSKLMNTSTSVNRHNLAYDWTLSGDVLRNEFKPVITPTGTVPNWSAWEAYGADDGKIVDRINLVMLNGTMTTGQRQSMLTAMAAVKNSNAALQTRRRAQVALYIAASSPLFQVDR